MIEFPLPEALTFDDVLLVPGASSVLPGQVSTTTRLTRKIELHHIVHTMNVKSCEREIFERIGVIAMKSLNFLEKISVHETVPFMPRGA